MEEIVVHGLVLGGVTYKEKDKILNVYSLEKGIISCKLIGALKSNAKLKNVKEPFCFAELYLTSKNADFYTITSANIIDSFYPITENIENYFYGCAILEILKKVGQQANQPLFLETLKALKAIAYDKIDAKLVLSKYLISIFQAMGYALALDRCAVCGDRFVGKRYFNSASGEIVCFSCKMFNAEEISPLTHATLRIIFETSYENLKNLKLKKEGLNSAFSLLVENFELRFETSLSAINKLPE
ncbi:MAG: DNA repair protein RecO [Clostridia bacterium]|nr:DNA repair protein RecO [Clostridia bacterium]